MFTQPRQPRYGKSASSGIKPEGLFNAIISKVVYEGKKTLFVNAVIDTPTNKASVVVDGLVGSKAETASTPRVFAQVPRLAAGFDFGPLDFIGQVPAVGDRAFVGLREGRQDDLVLLTSGEAVASSGGVAIGGDLVLMLMGG